jgi:hypothetical protein
MWRAFFLALGISLCVLGGECLVVHKFVMAGDQPPQEVTPATLFGAAPQPSATSRDIEPAEWAPWTFLTAGAVVILYALTVNKQG